MIKYQNSSEDSIGARPQTSLKISLREAEVLWPIGPNDKREDFPNGQAWLWNLRWRELQ